MRLSSQCTDVLLGVPGRVGGRGFCPGAAATVTPAGEAEQEVFALSFLPGALLFHLCLAKEVLRAGKLRAHGVTFSLSVLLVVPCIFVLGVQAAAPGDPAGEFCIGLGCQYGPSRPQEILPVVVPLL